VARLVSRFKKENHKEGKMIQRCFETFGLFLLLIFSLFSLSQGETLISQNEETLSIGDRLVKNDFEHLQNLSELTNSYFVYEGESTGEKITTDVYGFKGKSVKRAFLYSMVIPGTGEFYANSKIKAALFFGLDVTFWSLYFNYHKKGKNKENEFEKFADQHWMEDNYRAWLQDSLGITSGSDQDSFWNKEKQRWDWLSHHLPDKKDQQYYEMIGKYDQFKYGWDDFPDDSSQPHRNFYLDLRRDSNNWLNKAKYSAMFSLANHILSAFDAAISIRKYNKKGERFTQLEFQMRLTERNEEIVPKLSMSMRF
jgi:hypothetical protein